MAAFQSGFQLGTAAFGQGQRMALAQEELAMAKERDARAAELHKQALEEGGLRVAGMRRVNDATDNLDRLTRVGVQNPDAIKANDADFDMAVEATGRGLAMPKAAPMQQEWRGATPVELNQAQMGLAAAKGDVTGMEALRLGRKGIDYEEGYKKFSKEWADMDDASKGALIDKLSLDSGVKGYGSWVPGKGKQAGYMNYLPPGGDPIKLSAKEAGDLYTLSNLMQVDPLRARGEMDKVSDKVRAIAAQAFEAQSKGVTANNQATRFGNADANDAARLDILDKELGIKRGAAAATAQYYRDRSNAERMGNAQYFTGQDGNTYASIPRMGKNGLTFETVRVNPEGVKMTKVGSGAEMKPADVKEEGTKVTIGGKLQYADGLGGYIPAGPNGKPAGVLPSERLTALKKAGVPDNLIDRLEWNKDGTAVGLNGMRFDLNELKNIKTEYERLGKNEIEADEDRKRSFGMHSASNRLRNAPPEPMSTSGFGPTITYRPEPNAPSIYAGPEEWEAYRRFQQTR